MPVEYQDIMAEQHARIQAERSQAAAELEAARMAYDNDRIAMASDAILNCDLRENALATRAQQFVASQTPIAQSNRFGLTRDEEEIARNSFTNDNRMTNDQRDEIYARNKQKLQYLRSTGQYRDDQGTVRR